MTNGWLVNSILIIWLLSWINITICCVNYDMSNMQEISIKIMISQSRNSRTVSSSVDSKIINSFNRTALENCIFIDKSLKGLLPSEFSSQFRFSLEVHSHDTWWKNLDYLNISFYQTKICVRYSMIANTIFVWTHLQSCHQNVIFNQLRLNKMQ